MADKYVEDKFRDRLSNYEEEPGDDSWAFIEGKLPPGKSPRPGWIIPALITGLIAIIGVTTFLLLPDEEVIKREMEAKASESNDVSLMSEEKSTSVLPGSGHQEISSDEVSSNVSDRRQPDQPNVSLPVIGSEAKADKTDHLEPKGYPIYDVSQELSTTHTDGPRSNDHVAAWASPAFLQRLGFEFSYGEPRLSDLKAVEGNEDNETPPVKEKKAKKALEDRKFTLYFQAMPTLTYNRVEANRNDDQLVLAVEKLPALSTDRMGVRIESGVTYPVSTKLNVFAGLLYYQKSQKIEYSLQQVDSVGVLADGDVIDLSPLHSEEKNTYNYQLQNIGLQLGMTYTIPSNKLESSVGLGVELHRSLRRSTHEIFQEPDLYLFYNVFYRVEYPKDKRFRLLAQPTFNYSLDLNKNLNTPFYVKPYGFGLNFGFTFKL